MPKNESIVDWKPSNEPIVDWKPKSEPIIDWKSKNVIPAESRVDQLFEVVLGAGQPIGILLAITYPVAGTVQSSYSP